MTAEPKISDRGFGSFDPLPSTYGGTVGVSESSAASGPHIWLRTVTPVNLNDPTGAMQDGVAHLTLETATELRDQLTWLIENHYQVRPRTAP